MAAYLVGHIKVIDEELWNQYVAGVAESITHYEAKIIFRGKLDKILAGKHQYDLAVVIEFNNQYTIDAWYESEKYQALIPLRDKAADVVITTYKA